MLKCTFVCVVEHQHSEVFLSFSLEVCYCFGAIFFFFFFFFFFEEGARGWGGGGGSGLISPRCE